VYNSLRFGTLCRFHLPGHFRRLHITFGTWQKLENYDVTMLNSKSSHHSWLSCMKGVIYVQWQNYSASDINTCIQFQLNYEYHNSAFSVYIVYQFINNKYIWLILPIKWTTVHTFMCLARGVQNTKMQLHCDTTNVKLRAPKCTKKNIYI